MRSFRLLFAGAVVAIPLSLALTPVGVGASQPPPNQPVTVTNFPATQNVSGSVGVNNFPATQAVSGTVSVSNLPAIQPVSGSVDVANLPVTDGKVQVALPARVVAHGEFILNSNERVALPTDMIATDFIADFNFSTNGATNCDVWLVAGNFAARLYPEQRKPDRLHLQTGLDTRASLTEFVVVSQECQVDISWTGYHQ